MTHRIARFRSDFQELIESLTRESQPPRDLGSNIHAYSSRYDGRN
jgi:hypothetical protein